MRIEIHQLFLNKIIKAIEEQRREFFSVYTAGLKSQMEPPWSYNEPSEQLVASLGKSTLDYDLRLNSISMEIDSGYLNLEADLMAISARNFDKKEEVEFRSSIKLQSGFRTISNLKNEYPMLVKNVEITSIQPPGLKVFFSWMVAHSMNDSDLPIFSIPKSIDILKSQLSLDFKEPLISEGVLVLEGSING